MNSISWSDIFEFGILITSIISLVLQARKK